MTDNEVIKALEVCAYSDACLKECPLFNYKADCIKRLTASALEIIKRHQSDVAPVVRCKDCKYFNHKELECRCDGIVQDLADSGSFRLNFYLDDYCSYGVRKEDDNG